jgi:hypothetical protein
MGMCGESPACGTASVLAGVLTRVLCCDRLYALRSCVPHDLASRVFNAQCEVKDAQRATATLPAPLRDELAGSLAVGLLKYVRDRRGQDGNTRITLYVDGEPSQLKLTRDDRAAYVVLCRLGVFSRASRTDLAACCCYP